MGGYIPVQPGPQGGIYSPSQPAVPNTSKAGNILAGLEQFMLGFRKSRQDEEKEAGEKFKKMMELAALGIPIDTKEAAKLAKRSGLGIDLEGPTPKEMKQQMDVANFVPPPPGAPLGAGVGMGLPGMGPGMPPPGMGPPGMPPGIPGIGSFTPPSPTQQSQLQEQEEIHKPKGFGGRMLENLGWTPPKVSSSSPFATAMQAMQDKALSTQQLDKMQTEGKKIVQQLMNTALDGSPDERAKAKQILQSTGILQSPNELQLLIEQKGPEEAGKIVEAVMLAPRDQIKATYDMAVAKMDADKTQNFRDDLQDTYDSLREVYPFAGDDILRRYALGRTLEAYGDEDGARDAGAIYTKYLSKLKSKPGQIGPETTKSHVDMMKWAEELEISKGQLDVSRGNLALGQSQFARQQGRDVIEDTQKGKDLAVKVMSQVQDILKNAKSDDERTAAVSLISTFLNQAAGGELTKTEPGSKWLGMREGPGELRLNPPPKSLSADLTDPAGRVGAAAGITTGPTSPHPVPPPPTPGFKPGGPMGPGIMPFPPGTGFQMPSMPQINDPRLWEILLNIKR